MIWAIPFWAISLGANGVGLISYDITSILDVKGSA